jgi:hypothetical protein
MNSPHFMEPKCPLPYIGRVNRMVRKRKASQVFNNSPQGSRLRGHQKKKKTQAV